MNADRMVEETAAAPTFVAPVATPVDTPTAAIQPKTKKQLKKERRAAMRKNKQTSLNAATLDEFDASNLSYDSSQSNGLTSDPNAVQQKSKNGRKASRKQSKAFRKQSKANSKSKKGEGKKQKPNVGKSGEKNTQKAK